MIENMDDDAVIEGGLTDEDPDRGVARYCLSVSNTI